MLKRPHRLIIRKDRRREFRWRLEARNGACILASSEGYRQYRGCYRNLMLVLRQFGLRIPLEWRRNAVKISGKWSPRRRNSVVSFTYVATYKDGTAYVWSA